MADTAFQTQYRQEAIASFEQQQSLLRGTTVTEAVIKGNTAVFLVAGSGDADAVTRGVNGLIPARADDLTQNSCTLSEWHDLVRKTNFNVFASQGDQRAIMQRTTMAVINRKIDQQIITELNTATNDTGAAVTASLNLFTKAKVILGNNKVPWDGWITLLGTPAFFGYLLQAPEFSNVQYVNQKPMESGPDWRDQPVMYRWRNVVMLEHPELPGVGTSAEKCFMYHRNAIGHAADKAGMETPVGYDEEQGYSFARASMNMGAKLLQNSGVVVINHNGEGFAAS
jgi:hypothetical protein